MSPPGRLPEVLRALARAGRPLLVGGCVRDGLLGLETTDFDVEVYGAGWAEVLAATAPFGPTDVVGRSFGVIKLRLDELTVDISLPRIESKTGAGHRGFRVTPVHELSPVEASARRDFTINAMLRDPFRDELIDPHGGAGDLRRGILRHTSAAFVEDPLRVLRGMQFAARFGLTLAAETAALCRGMLAAFGELPVERVWGEWEKLATLARAPSHGLAALRDSGWLAHFPELAALAGLPQDPEWHPEGDVFAHVGYCLDALVELPAWTTAEADRRALLFFAVLAHDLGKAVRTVRADREGVSRWTSPGHDQAGGPIAEAFLARIGAPPRLRLPVARLVENHHAHQSWPEEGPSRATVRRLTTRLAPASIADLLVVLEADHRGRPPRLSEATRLRIDRLAAVARELGVERRPPAPLLRGRDLIDAGLAPGPAFGRLLAAAFEAQLEGAFDSREGALAWLRAKG